MKTKHSVQGHVKGKPKVRHVIDHMLDSRVQHRSTQLLKRMVDMQSEKWAL